MRDARRAARAALAATLIAIVLVSLLPALPVLGRGPVKVIGRHVQISIERQQVVQLPIEASHVLLKWRGEPEAQLSVAFGEAPDKLGEDVALANESDDDATPDDADAPPALASLSAARKRAALADNESDVIWTGGARYARVTTDRPIGTLTVIAIDAGSQGIAPTPPAVASAAVDAPTIIPRSGWGADESMRFDAGGHETWPPEFAPMQLAIVHHTAGRNNDPNPAATIRAIYWAKSISRGYGDIGYNFLIDESGRIYEGRHSRNYAPGEQVTGEDLAGNVVRGVHAKSHNYGTVGIALLGNFQHRQPTLAARTALDRLLAWKLERHGLNPLGSTTYTSPLLDHTENLKVISGHRNVNATACPGGDFYDTFPLLRQRVAQRIASTTGASHDTDPPTVDSLISMNDSPTGSHVLNFGLIFDEPVQGLDASDFDVGGSSHGWDVTDVSGGPEGYTVEVSADHPDGGTVQLQLAADAVTDLAGLSGPADPVSASATYADDSDPPTLLLYATPHKHFITDPKLNWFNVTATFSEPVTGFDESDVVLGGTSHAGKPWAVPDVYGEVGGASYGFSVANGSWYNGTLTFSVPDGVATDLAGNPSQASNEVSIVLDAGKPTTSWPRAFLRAGTTLGNGSLRVNVSWTGSDIGPSGIAGYEVARSIDGKPFHLIASGVTGNAIGWGVPLGHTYRFEVRARDNAGNIGSWIAGPTLRAGLVQQNSSLVRFAGATTPRTNGSFTGGSARSLDAAGASATFTTTARSLSFVTTTGPGRGEVNVYVDGVFQGKVDLGAASTTYRFVAFSKTWGSIGKHTIRVVAVGTAGRPRVDVDAFGFIR